MLEFLAQHGPSIISAVLGIAGMMVGVYNVIKCFKMGKKIDTTTVSLETNIQVIKDGIVEAFKSAKLPSEIKLSISNKLEEILGQVRDTVITEFKKNEAARTMIMLLILKILRFSQASSKLTDEEKNKIKERAKSGTKDED